MSKKRDSLILIILIILLVALNYSFFDNYLNSIFSQGESAKVVRIIDGDTIEIQDGRKVRLLGINTPEKKEKYYEEAKNFIENKILNKTVELEYGKEKTDLYNRTLAYVNINGENINLEIINAGYANYYFPEGKEKYYSNFKNAWENCMDEGINLCEGSKNKCSECIELEELDVSKQEAVFYNGCEFECNLEGWSIKDEGRKKYIFHQTILRVGEEIKITEKDFKENYVWTKSGDSLFLRDENNLLVLFYSY